MKRVLNNINNVLWLSSSFCIILFTINDRIHSRIAHCSSKKGLFDNTKCYLYCRYRRISNRLTVDMHVERIDTTESIHHVIIYILAMLQWSKVSLVTLLSTVYCYFASDDQKCIHYCTHCRKLKCIHYYSCNIRLFTFYYKRDSICKAFTTYNPCICVDTPLPYSLITNTATQILGGNLLRNLFDIQHTWDTVWFEQYSIYYFNVVCMHIFWFENIFITLRVGSPHVRSYFWWAGGGIEVKKTCV